MPIVTPTEAQTKAANASVDEDNLKEELEKIDGVKNVEYYGLVNNYGYTLEKNGKQFDIRRWVNCYGADLKWGIEEMHRKEGSDFKGGTGLTLEQVLAKVKEA